MHNWSMTTLQTNFPPRTQRTTCWLVTSRVNIYRGNSGPKRHRQYLDPLAFYYGTGRGKACGPYESPEAAARAAAGDPELALDAGPWLDEVLDETTTETLAGRAALALLFALDSEAARVGRIALTLAEAFHARGELLENDRDSVRLLVALCTSPSGAGDVREIAAQIAGAGAGTDVMDARRVRTRAAKSS